MATQLRIGVLVAPFLALSLVFVAGWLGIGPSLSNIADESLAWLMHSLGWAFICVGVIAIVATLALYGLLGHVRIGGSTLKPGHSGFSAVAIGVAASTSLGLLFWASAEPVYHIHHPPGALGLSPLTEDAQIFALYTTMIHWALIANVMNALCMTVFALTIQNLNRRPTLDGAIFRADTVRPVGSVLDSFLVFFATLMTVVAFASCIAALSGEMSRFGSNEPNPAALFALALAMAFVVFVAGARPIRTVFALLARAALILMIIMIVITLVIGPSVDILGGGLQSIWQMLWSLPAQMTYTGLSSADPWPQTWTMTHWGNAMLFAPLVGLFLSRAARGYTVSDAIFYFSIIPAGITMCWIMVFGGLALSIDEATNGSIWATINRGSANDAAYAALWSLPGGESLMIGFIILIALAFATFAAAMMHAVMRVCAPGPDSDLSTAASRASIAMGWCAGVGFGGWSLASSGISQVVETLARLGSLPALFVTVGFLIAALRLILRPRSLTEVKKPDAVKIDFDFGDVVPEDITDIEIDKAAKPRRRRRKSA